MLEPSKQYRSPNFVAESVPVEFLVLHYTAQSLKGTLDIFLTSKSRVSSHLLIGQEGDLYELVKCWDGTCYKAFHAGKSFWKEGVKLWKNFNSFSIGIEIINLNGNLFSYTEPQKQTLVKVINHLKEVYPALKNLHRILGHEHISGFRGKADPGCLFEWNELFKNCFPKEKHIPQRTPVYSKHQGQAILKILNNPTHLSDERAKKISLILENPFPFWFKKLQTRFTK